MKLPAAVLATLCAAGCEVAQAPEPLYPTQPVETYEVTEPDVEAVEMEPDLEEPHFAQPPSEAGVAPVRRVAPQPPQRIPHIDDCPGCGMG